jgi:hypothetical protein
VSTGHIAGRRVTAALDCEALVRADRIPEAVSPIHTILDPAWRGRGS